MYTGSEKAHPFRDLAVPAPRGHKPPFPGRHRGRRVRRRPRPEAAGEGGRGGPLRHRRRPLSSSTDRGGPAGGRRDLEALHRVRGGPGRRGGDRGRRLRDERGDGRGLRAPSQGPRRPGHGPRQLLRRRPRASRMGESVGGLAEHMEGAFFTSPFYPPGDALKGIIVNKAGRRFVNEDVYHARSAAALFEQPGAEGYLILDSATMVEPAYGFHPLVDGWETVEEMESALGMPDGSLVETMRAYNEHAARGEDPLVPQGRRVADPARPGSVGRLRPHARQGVLRRLHPRRAARLRRRRGADRGRRPGARACTPRAPAPRTSRSTGRATPAAPSSARRRTSAVGPAATPPRWSGSRRRHSTSDAATPGGWLASSPIAVRRVHAGVHQVRDQALGGVVQVVAVVHPDARVVGQEGDLVLLARARPRASRPTTGCRWPLAVAAEHDGVVAVQVHRVGRRCCCCELHHDPRRPPRPRTSGRRGRGGR